MNMGAYTYVAPRIETALKKDRGIKPKYVGRPPSSATATGYGFQHKAEVEQLLKEAFA